MKTKMKIQGMHCASCKMLIEETVADLKGVKSCSVDPKTGIAMIEHDATITPKTIAETIEASGEYSVTLSS